MKIVKIYKVCMYIYRNCELSVFVDAFNFITSTSSKCFAYSCITSVFHIETEDGSFKKRSRIVTIRIVIVVLRSQDCKVNMFYICSSTHNIIYHAHIVEPSHGNNFNALSSKYWNLQYRMHRNGLHSKYIHKPLVFVLLAKDPFLGLILVWICGFNVYFTQNMQ